MQKNTKRPTKGKEPKNKVRCAYFPFFLHKKTKVTKFFEGDKNYIQQKFCLFYWSKWQIC